MGGGGGWGYPGAATAFGRKPAILEASVFSASIKFEGTLDFLC